MESHKLQNYYILLGGDNAHIVNFNIGEIYKTQFTQSKLINGNDYMRFNETIIGGNEWVIEINDWDRWNL